MLVKDQPLPTPYYQKILTKNGKERDIEVTWNYLRDTKGGVVGFLSVLTDITNRKRAEKELKFRSGITEQLNASVITTGLDFKINWVNQAFSTLYGYFLDEVIGQTPDFLNIDPLSDEIQNDIYKTVSSGEVWTGEAMNQRKDGTTFLCEMDIFPLKDENGGIFAYASYQRDITDRKKAEQALQEVKDELEVRVKDRTSDLERTVKLYQKEIKDRKKAEKNIRKYQDQLRALISKMSLIEEKERKLISEVLHDNIGQYLALSKINLSKLQKSYPVIQKDIEGTKTLIEQTIEYTRSLTFEVANPVLYKMGLDKAVEWLIEQFQEKHDLKVTFRSDGNIGKLKGEIEALLFKTVRELLINVVKHAQVKTAMVSISNDRVNIKINVEDNGIGFDTSKIEHYTIKNKKFGLFNMSERINYLGGTFKIKSKGGQGTKATVMVPIS
jgi:PAS domain S-box-containing protein